jgi:GT2 family glycosyltransferase
MSSREGNNARRQAAPRCSIIVPVFNRAWLTRQCIDVLLSDPPVETDREIIVVDDASSDTTSQILASYGDQIRVIAHEANTGFATACNDGAAAAAGEYLVFLNNDTLPFKGWLDALVRYADRHPKAAVVGSKLLFPDDTIQHAGVAITEDRGPRHIYAGFPADHPAVNKSRRFQIVTAACALFRRGPFEDAGGFDDSFVNGFEDVDLCLRLGELGHEVHYCHEAALYHLEEATRDRSDYLQNYELYIRRWRHKVEPDAFLRYIEDGLVQLRFADRFPFFLKVSPLLAVIEGEEREREADRLLADRARQVFELSRDNVTLRLKLAEAGIESGPFQSSAAPPQREHRPNAVYFVSDTPGDAMRYRCYHHAEELRMLGATAEVSMLPYANLANSLDSYACFILHRVPLSEGIDWFIDEAHRRGKLVLFDTDDLVFELGTAAKTLDHIETPDVEKRVFADRLERHARTMAMCDAVLVTTEPLAELAREINGRVFVIPNAASEEMVDLADAALAAKDSRSDGRQGVTIAYLSGTPTHDRDFLQAAEAVLWALQHHPTCRFLVVGNLSLDDRFDSYADRILTIPIQPWRRLPRILAGVEISLAPLEADNPFTESKSCLKYVEASLLSVPTIASPRPDFVRAINSGRNGLLAESPDEWREALDELIKSRQLREEIGRAAQADVRAHHTTSALAPRLYETIGRLMMRNGTARSLTVHWLVHPSSLDDERADAVACLVRHLRSHGHMVRVFADGDERRGYASGFPQGVELEALPEEPDSPLADVAVATDVHSASTLAERSDALFKIHLVGGHGRDGRQALSDTELREAVELPLRPVCLGEQLATRLNRLRRMEVDCLPLPVEPGQFEQMLLTTCFARAASLTAVEPEPA